VSNILPERHAEKGTREKRDDKREEKKMVQTTQDRKDSSSSNLPLSKTKQIDHHQGYRVRM